MKLGAFRHVLYPSTRLCASNGRGVARWRQRSAKLVQRVRTTRTRTGPLRPCCPCCPSLPGCPADRQRHAQFLGTRGHAHPRRRSGSAHWVWHHRCSTSRGGRARARKSGKKNVTVDATDGVLRWERLTWCEVAALRRRLDMAILPVGSTEQHGPHLTMDTDTVSAVLVAE